MEMDIPILGNLLLNMTMIAIIMAIIYSFYVKFAKVKNDYSRDIISAASSISLSLLSLSFITLIYGFITTDLDLELVYSHSHPLKPLIYKISGTWGNHEGSMLLISLIIAIYTYLYSKSSVFKVDKDYKKISISIMLLVQLSMLVFIIFTSNPFDRNLNPTSNGMGLNPLLQDIGLALHPPILYLGYIGLVIPFACSLSSLIHSYSNKEFANEISMWLLIAWSFLTLGIGIGSWWAYRELGWGGFWFWDPVENASLMPWLSATAFIHTAIVLRKRQSLILWTLLLAIMSFSLSLIGMFLVRSGILTSVHSFASDPTRGMFILLIIGITVISSLTIFAFKSNKLVVSNGINLKSRETFILFGTMLIIVCLAIVMLGTLYPIIMELVSGTSLSVGAPYFNKTFNYIAVITLLFTIIAPYIKWGHHKKFSFSRNSIIIFIATFVITALIIIKTDIKSLLSIGALFVSLGLIVSLVKFAYKQKIKLSHAAMISSHLGIALMCLAIGFLGDLSIEKESYMKIDDVIEIGDFKVKLVRTKPSLENNYAKQEAFFSLYDYSMNKEIARLTSEYRFYPVEKQYTTETSLYKHILYDIYVAIWRNKRRKCCC